MKNIRTKKKKKIIKLTKYAILIVFAIIGILPFKEYTKSDYALDVSNISIPAYSGTDYDILNNNIPYFDPKEFQSEDFEEYSELDLYGRCGTAFANLCKELMPTESRGQIGHIKPSGWNQKKYPGIINSKPPYLYNRCHLIGFQLAGENDNEKNLITGTRYFNVNGMLPFENEVREYIDQTNNHVLYRVTPVFEKNNMLAKGVIIEAYSVEDKGSGIEFNVFVHNIQPGIEIDYSNGESQLKVN
ncbi:MAG: DNA/RNA non-specific endonuclease [Clostridia bacterium]|nr:DNA/RNA non-specific endonuclease [Clostridia bacterium]